MCLEGNKMIVRRFIEEGLNKNNSSVMDELLAPDFVLIQGETVTRRGPEDFKKLWGVAFARWANFRDSIIEMVSEGDTVMVRSIRSGVHTGDYVSPIAGKIAPTGKKADWAYFQIYRLAGGKITDYRYVFDEASLLRQLGAIQ